MSAISLAWVASVKVGNHIAKQLLLFYASHNFPGDTYVFKNETLANQLEVSERAIQSAHKLLLDGGFIKKEIRFDEHGRQKTNSIVLNIPNEFVDKFFGEGERSAPLGVHGVQGEGERRAPLLNNKAFNNKSNNKAVNNFEKPKAAEAKQIVKFWEPGNPDYDRVNGTPPKQVGAPMKDHSTTGKFNGKSEASWT